MFKPQTTRIEKLSKIFPVRVTELEKIFDAPTVVYVDWANVIHWQEELDWHLHLGRIKQLHNSFDNVKKVRLYHGTLDGNEKSKKQINEIKNLGYDLVTKPVKLIRISIDISSIPDNSPAILKNFIKKSLLKKLDLETISFLNSKLGLLNKQGIMKLEEPKCNFDVEIGRDMLSDFQSGEYQNFVLWSGDSDFKNPIQQLITDGKKVTIVSMSGWVTPEISELKVPIFELRKIKEFICWPKEIPMSLKSQIDT